MKKQKLSILLSILTLAVLAFPTAAAAPTLYTHSASPSGIVYTMSNSPTGNQVLAFDMARNGTLTPAGTYPTGGNGTGTSLGDQGALALSQDGRWLLAVDAGSNQISVFRVTNHGLKLADVAGANGTVPISVTTHGSLVYVLDNASSNSPGNIAGYYLGDHGQLWSIPGSIQPLSGGVTGTAQISFNPKGTVLVVTEKTTNIIDTYTLNRWGVASGPITTASNGVEPFGFAFDDRGQLIVSEAASGSLSSYRVFRSGNLSTVSSSIVDGGVAPCWVAVTGDGSYAYTANAHGNTISSYTVSGSGKLTLLQSVAASPDSGPNDITISSNDRFLFVYDAGAHEIQSYSISWDGALTPLQTVSGVPAGAEGLVAN